MNQYLLLRDNKQSGPYTVREIIAKGIKPYDLVWLEGKSAAWRYPSEIEELKAHAPAVEEQPFDRFYKRPEAETAPVIQPQPEKRSRFEPVIPGETVRKNDDAPPKKVYINFPGGTKKLPVYQEPKKEQPVVPAISTAPISNPIEPVRETIHTTLARTPTADRKLMYAAIAACFVLIIIISILIINYGNQRSSISQLNEMVQQMEKRQNEASEAAKTALASHAIPQPAPVSDPPVTDYSFPPATIIKSVTEKPVAHASSIHPVIPIVAKPVMKEQATQVAEKVKAEILPATTGNESLFNLVSIKPSKYKTGLLGGISNLQFVLTNNSTRQLQRVAVEIKYFGPEKKLVKTQTVYFEKVAPGSQPVLDVPKSNRGVSIGYAITDIKS